MNVDKFKRIILKTGIVFFAFLGILTYFSKTIDNMLLPRVKTTVIETGRIDEAVNTSDMKTHYLLPLSSVDVTGDQGTVYVINYSEDSNITVKEQIVRICNSDDFYCEVTSDSLYGEELIVYQTSKNISDGCRVYLEEEK